MKKEQLKLFKYQKRHIVSIKEQVLDYDFEVSTYIVNISEYNKEI